MWVKICGIRDERTAVDVTDCGPDAIGLNFYAGSRRYVTAEIGARIAAATGDRIDRIGVFVNHPVDEVEDLARTCCLRGIQFHGDETLQAMLDVAVRLPGIPVYRAWRMKDSLAGMSEATGLWKGSGLNVRGCLVDAHVPGMYGGSGQTVSWDVLSKEYIHESWPALILAGGLTPENVAPAITTVRPWGVDVASGVENLAGQIDPGRVRRFIESAKQAGTPR